MDIDAVYEAEQAKPSNNKNKKKKKKNKAKVEKIGGITGRMFSAREKKFVKDNFERLTDAQIARKLGRTIDSIKSYRNKKGLQKPSQGIRKAGPSAARADFVGHLDDYEKAEHFRRQLRLSATYKAFVEACNNTNYIKLYEQKFIEFMMDPTVETVTSMERDIWHEMTVAQIRELDYIRKEKVPVTRFDKEDEAYDIFPDYSKEISECTKIIQKCQESLNVTRSQRLKDGGDQAITFTEVVKELRSSATRRKAGEEAAMLKYIAERHYNDHIGKNIISGKFDLGLNFKDGKEPEGLDGDFTQEKAFLKAEEIDEDQPLVGKTGEEEKTKGGG